MGQCGTPARRTLTQRVAVWREARRTSTAKRHVPVEVESVARVAKKYRAAAAVGGNHESNEIDRSGRSTTNITKLVASTPEVATNVILAGVQTSDICFESTCEVCVDVESVDLQSQYEWGSVARWPDMPSPNV